MNLKKIKCINILIQEHDHSGSCGIKYWYNQTFFVQLVCSKQFFVVLYVLVCRNIHVCVFSSSQWHLMGF